ncbi:hypothetical protein [Acetivibrio ethanolgignens]|uniref:Uncharacterized protein n=1 Tax=Acetivibrio ethanolgignens TaxID=290052 RepID=A0A0V8QCE6_9FIRM|nr:hypothetical protein [Acetivibrio ethanolgignens]KSV58271.1 hypothetical protein ASU35_13490 [Acetivibrio ethanolgignens]
MTKIKVNVNNSTLTFRELTNLPGFYTRVSTDECFTEKSTTNTFSESTIDAANVTGDNTKIIDAFGGV